MDYAGRPQSSNIEDRRNDGMVTRAVRHFVSELTRPIDPIIASNPHTEAVERAAERIRAMQGEIRRSRRPEAIPQE